jgi:Protein of unknown function with PCYCGC motif
MKQYVRLTSCLMVFLLLAGLTMPAFAMDAQQKKEFDRIMNLEVTILTDHATTALQKKYPGENWAAYHFPAFVSRNESAEAGYKIAVKRPELLEKIHCACACEVAGHKNLLDCFLKRGKPGEYDRHASLCTICYTQAMLAFLWAELGATDQEIAAGMRAKSESGY